MFPIFLNVGRVLADEHTGSAVRRAEQGVTRVGFQILPKVALGIRAKGTRRIKLDLEMAVADHGERDDPRPKVISNGMGEEVRNSLRCFRHPKHLPRP